MEVETSIVGLEAAALDLYSPFPRVLAFQRRTSDSLGRDPVGRRNSFESAITLGGESACSCPSSPVRLALTTSCVLFPRRFTAAEPEKSNKTYSAKPRTGAFYFSILRPLRRKHALWSTAKKNTRSRRRAQKEGFRAVRHLLQPHLPQMQVTVHVMVTPPITGRGSGGGHNSRIKLTGGKGVVIQQVWETRVHVWCDMLRFNVCEKLFKSCIDVA